MARKTETKRIGEYEYVFTQFNPRKSLRVLTRLGRYMGGPIAHVFNKKDPKKSILDADLGDAVFGEAIIKVFGGIGDDDMYTLASDIADSVVLKTAPKGEITGVLQDAVFDDHFSGPDGLKRMFNVLKEALGVNYKDFLGDIAANVAASQESSSPAG